MREEHAETFDSVQVTDGDLDEGKLQSRLKRDSTGEASLQVGEGKKSVLIDLGNAKGADDKYFTDNPGSGPSADSVSVYQDSMTGGTRVELAQGSEHIDFILADGQLKSYSGNWANEIKSPGLIPGLDSSSLPGGDYLVAGGNVGTRLESVRPGTGGASATDRSAGGG